MCSLTLRGEMGICGIVGIEHLVSFGDGKSDFDPISRWRYRCCIRPVRIDPCVNVVDSLLRRSDVCFDLSFSNENHQRSRKFKRGQTCSLDKNFR